MTLWICNDGQDALIARGYSTHQIDRAAMLVSGGAGGSCLWSGIRALPEKVSPKIQINRGEYRELLKVPETFERRGYAPSIDHQALVDVISHVEKIPSSYISTWPGCNAALARSVVAFCSPSRGLVLADPSYETPHRAAAWLNLPIKKVSLKPDCSHDVKAMLAADPNAGLYYICSPCSATGTATSMADIEWLVNNKSQGAMVVIDEAYIQWSSGFPDNTANYLVRLNKDVLVMRTFSKFFGMAGMRAAYFMARPDIIEMLQVYDKEFLSRQLPPSSAACAIENITQAALIVERRKKMTAARTSVEGRLAQFKLRVMGLSETNVLMIDWKTKTANEMLEAFLSYGIEIARPFSVWPTASRITIGSNDDMNGFFDALERIDLG